MSVVPKYHPRDTPLGRVVRGVDARLLRSASQTRDLRFLGSSQQTKELGRQDGWVEKCPDALSHLLQRI